jgi:hypothetical protein
LRDSASDVSPIRFTTGTGGTNGNLTYLAPAVAALVIKLSNAADHRAKIIERWTKAVVWLTTVLVILTIALVYKEFAPDLPKLH